jgi:ERCC4-type nuclease
MSSNNWILVDDRQERTYIPKLESMGIPCKVEHLDVGDFILGDIIVERKMISDLFGSLRSEHGKSPRLWDQLYAMRCKQPDYRGMLVVVGPIPTFDFFTNKPMEKNKYLYFKNTFDNVELRTYLSFHLGFHHLNNMNEFFNLIKRIWDYCGKKPSVAPVSKKSETIEDISEDVLCCIPKIGRKTSMDLIANYGVIPNILEEDKSVLLRKYLNKPQLYNLFWILKNEKISDLSNMPKKCAIPKQESSN